ncbi:hypothetical protein AVEN_53364-1 [Araneus ventricosus]|uniref:Uncharacterized protein n=1 Tax=Araneus ventricosus TaxID=182803 RepID=A0A4Y2A9W6_ARAVE|nr:hypothetical protein AVEN_53364-1 [Araneus ventricosus]
MSKHENTVSKNQEHTTYMSGQIPPISPGTTAAVVVCSVPHESERCCGAKRCKDEAFQVSCSLASQVVCSLASQVFCSLAYQVFCSLASQVFCSLASQVFCSLASQVFCSLAAQVFCSLASQVFCSSYYLFQPLKMFLVGQNFYNDEDVQMAVTLWLRSQAAYTDIGLMELQFWWFLR